MKKIYTMIAAMVLAMSMFAAPAQASADKVGVCHRTASDTNPYVYIEVPKDEANGHITGDSKQHNGKATWKSDGTWRGETHSAGDVKFDYYAASSVDCNDLTVTPTEPTPTEPEPTVPTPTTPEPTTPEPTEPEPTEPEPTVPTPTTPVDECEGPNGEDLCEHETPEPTIDPTPTESVKPTPTDNEKSDEPRGVPQKPDAPQAADTPVAVPTAVDAGFGVAAGAGGMGMYFPPLALVALGIALLASRFKRTKKH